LTAEPGVCQDEKSGSELKAREVSGE